MLLKMMFSYFICFMCKENEFNSYANNLIISDHLIFSLLINENLIYQTKMKMTLLLFGIIVKLMGHIVMHINKVVIRPK